MDEVNGTYITLDGYVEVSKYRYVYFVVIFTLYIITICSNCTIVYLIWRHKNLHEPMYIFIGALLLNSIIYSTAMYPKLLLDVLSDKQIMPYSACLFQFYLYYTIGSSEYLLLSAMAYDRYVSICKPLQHPTIMTNTTVSMFLFFAWLLPAIHIAVPTIMSSQIKLCDFTLKGIFCNNNIYELQCVRSRIINIYGIVILIDLIALPILFIIFTYTKILVITYHSCKEVRNKAAETCLPHILIIIISCFLIAYDVSVARVESDYSKIAHLIMMFQIVLYHPLFNPLIYGLKMKEISKHLKKLFCSAKNDLM